MTRSSKHYRAPTRVRRPNHLPVIFNTARLRSASPRVRRLARTVLRVYVYCLLLLLVVRSCVQVIGHTAEAVKTLATDPIQSNLSFANDQSPDECPLTEVIHDCLRSLFGKWAWHGPGDSDVDCPQVTVNVSDGHLNTCLIDVPLQDTLQNQTGSVGPEETSGQWQLPFPVASYSMAFKTMFHEIAFPIDFILWHTTLVTCNTFVHISLILYEFGPPLWTMNRETWRKLRKASSLSGKRGISRCRKTRVFLCVCAPSTHYFCTAVLKRFKHQALSKRICPQLVRLPSLGLGRGVRCGQKIHGRLVTSFTVQKSFVKRIRVRPHCPCPVLLSPVTHHSKSVTKVATVRLCVFLGLLLLLAGDVERNPGPRKGKEREASVPEVLKEYEDEFFQVVHPKYNLLKLVCKNVITEDIASRISATTDDEGRELLYHHLKHHGSVQTLREFCEVALAADCYPNMQKLAEKMLHAIPADGSGNRQEYTSPPSAAPPNIRGCHPAGNIDFDGSSGPMSPWNDAALVSLRERLKLNVSMNTGLSDRLEKAAGGFMSEHEAKMVREPTTASNMEKIEKIIEILRGKTNEDFATFCTMLRETNHVVWADELEKEAERFKRERKDVFGDGGRQEYMSPPTPVAPHISGHPPGDIGYGLPPPTWAPPQPFLPRQEVPYPHDVRQHVGQHQAPYTVGSVYPPLGYPSPRPHQGWLPPHQGTHIPPYWGAPGPSGITAPPPPPALPTQPFTTACDSPGSSQRAGMSDCYKDALLCFKSTLKDNVALKTGLEDKLPIAANGFMSRTEAQHVAQLPGNLDQMGAVVDCLCKKRDEDFFTFLKMLKDTSNGHWADALLGKAEELKRETVKVEREGGGGPSGGSGSAEEKEVGCCCSCVCACVVGLCVGVFMQRQIKAVSYTAGL